MLKRLVPALALVDYDNYANFRAFGAPTNALHVEKALDNLVLDLLNCCKQELPATNEIEARLYGGWYDRDAGGKSQRLRMLESAISHFPARCKGVRIILKPIDSLLAARHIPLRLEIRKETIKLKITDDMLAKCACPDNCLTKLVAEWQKNGCPHCRAPKEEILQRTTQKAVDTAIVADLVHAAGLESSKLLVLVSNDYDLLPGALHAEAGPAPFRIICTNDRCALSHEVNKSTLYIVKPFAKK